MNCTQVDKLLPLYAGQDLDDGRERKIAAHLELCNACVSAFAEYREARSLLHGFAAPEVTGEAHDQIRRSVGQQIAAESRRPSLLEALRDWFQTRWVWAAAAAVFLVVGAAGFYSLAKRLADQPQVAVIDPKGIVESSIGLIENPERNSSIPNAATSPQRQGGVPKRVRNPDRRKALDRADASVAAYSPGERMTKSESPAPTTGTDNLDFGRPASTDTLR